MSCLIDTSFIIATLMPKDKNHKIARSAVQKIREEQIIALPVLFEVFYVVHTRLGYLQAVEIFERVNQSNFRIENLTSEDRVRMIALMHLYSDSTLDFTDVAEIAIAERLNIQRIYTFDRRDFMMVRPKHCDYFDVLP